MLQREVLVLKLGAVDALSASAVVIGEVSSLAHEAWNDAMEWAAFVTEAFLTGTQRSEVLCTQFNSMQLEHQT